MIMPKNTSLKNGARNGRAKIEAPDKAIAESIAGDAAASDSAVGEAVDERLPISKTYKVFIGGKFPRGESGRYYPLRDAGGALLGNVCACSRKDFRDAVVAARAAQPKWAAASAYNRGQILYRVAEMLEGRAAQFVQELKQQGSGASEARREVVAAIDRLVYYAGWTDKYQQIFSSVNPVASPHFSFSMLEPTGVVALVAPDKPSLLGLVSLVAPTIAGANTCVALASTLAPLCAITFAEVLATSDVPGGVVNILTGPRADILPTVGSHMDVNAVAYGAGDARELSALREAGVENLKRIVEHAPTDWLGGAAQSPYFLLDLQETKTTWHPVGV